MIDQCEARQLWWERKAGQRVLVHLTSGLTVGPPNSATVQWAGPKGLMLSVDKQERYVAFSDVAFIQLIPDSDQSGLPPADPVPLRHTNHPLLAS